MMGRNWGAPKSPLHIETPLSSGFSSMQLSPILLTSQSPFDTLSMDVRSSFESVLRSNPLIGGDLIGQLTPTSNESSTSAADVVEKLPLLNFEGRFISDDVEMETPDASLFQDIVFKFD